MGALVVAAFTWLTVAVLRRVCIIILIYIYSHQRIGIDDAVRDAAIAALPLPFSSSTGLHRAPPRCAGRNLTEKLRSSFHLSIVPYRLHRLYPFSQRLSSGAALVNAAPLVPLLASFALASDSPLSHKKSLPNIVLGGLIGFAASCLPHRAPRLRRGRPSRTVRQPKAGAHPRSAARSADTGAAQAAPHARRTRRAQNSAVHCRRLPLCCLLYFRRKGE
jgi:hypothetical protein